MRQKILDTALILPRQNRGGESLYWDCTTSVRSDTLREPTRPGGNTMTINSYEGIINVRDITDRMEALEETSNGSVVDGSEGAEYEGHEDDHEEYAMLAALLNELRGYGGNHQWRGDWYPDVLIRDSYFVKYAQELAEDIGAINADAAWPAYCIDWDRAARELQIDYTPVEYDGITYWYR